MALCIFDPNASLPNYNIIEEEEARTNLLVHTINSPKEVLPKDSS